MVAKGDNVTTKWCNLSLKTNIFNPIYALIVVLITNIEWSV